jgi:hypothetical protein
MPETSTTTQSVRPTETSTVSPSATPPPASSGEATVEASEISGNSTQELSRQSPKNAKIAAAAAETSIATPYSDLAPTPTSVRANVDASGNSNQRLPAQSPNNADMGPAPAETSSPTMTVIPFLEHQ